MQREKNRSEKKIYAGYDLGMGTQESGSVVQKYLNGVFY